MNPRFGLVESLLGWFVDPVRPFGVRSTTIRTAPTASWPLFNPHKVEIYGNLWKSMEIYGNPWKSMEIMEIHGKYG